MFLRPLLNLKISVVLAILRTRNCRFSPGDIKETEDEEREESDQEDDHTGYQHSPSFPSPFPGVYKRGQISVVMSDL